LAQVLHALAVHDLSRPDIEQAQVYGEESLRLAEHSQDPELQMVINQTLHRISMVSSQHVAAIAHGEQVIAFYRTHRPTLTFDDAFDLAHTLGQMGFSLLPAGYPDRALRQAQEALNLMRRHDHRIGISGILGLLSAVHTMRGEWQAGLQVGQEQRDVSIRHNFLVTRTFSELNMGAALAMLGEIDMAVEQLRQVIAERTALGMNVAHAQCLSQLAEGCSRAGRVTEGLAFINEALGITDESNDRAYEPKSHQIKGDLLLLQNLDGDQRKAAQQEAENCFRRAIEVAQSQQARLWEVRALASLCRLLHRQGRDEGCCQQLADLYAWFTEGFETEDLQVVRAVLQEI